MDIPVIGEVIQGAVGDPGTESIRGGLVKDGQGRQAKIGPVRLRAGNRFLGGGIEGADAGDSATIQLLGDAVFSGIMPTQLTSANLLTPQAVDAFSDDDFIWSGNSTTTHSGASGASGPDWSNGHLIPGLPASGAAPVIITRN